MIKIIGLILMLIDHVGVFFYPEVLIFRIIGRLSFPIFAFGAARGFSYTSNLKMYIFRLFIFGLISQPLFYIAFGVNNLNVFFTLGCSLLMIYFFNINRILFCISFFLTPFLEYGLYGVIFIFVFYLFDIDKNPIKLCIFIFMINLVFIFFNTSYLQLFTVFFVPFYILVRNLDFKLCFSRFFYLVYPVHLLILIFIRSVWYD